jgi:hypothetical protein
MSVEKTKKGNKRAVGAQLSPVPTAPNGDLIFSIDL